MHMFNKYFFCLSMIEYLYQPTLEMVDMNIHELQFVADHLTTKECLTLSAALHEKSFQLDFSKLTASESHIRSKPCLLLLLEYDRGYGRRKTFQDLALRLREIGKPKLADKLSKTVYHEEALAIRRNFLNDPFKKMIPSKSAVLDEEVSATVLTPAFVRDRFWTPTMIWSVVLGTVSGLIMLSLAFEYFCPRALPNICYEICPKSCTVRWIACKMGMKAWCKGLRTDIMKTVTGNKTVIDDGEFYLI